MCGIGGVVDFSGKFPVTAAALRRMSAAIAHRGPDGAGLWMNWEVGDSSSANVAGQPQVGMVFRRLAVLDPDPRAMQPMSTPDGRFTMVFNGEIYNFRELREELAAANPGYAWRTTGDSEVLLVAYATWGAQCQMKLDGMYAFAIWDARERTLFLSRDPAGQKPLYVMRRSGAFGVNGVIAFASELGALRELDWFEDELDKPALRSYLRLGYVPRNESIYAGVAKMLPRSGELFAERPGTSSFSYASASVGGDRPSLDKLTATTRRLVGEAVRRQIVSDVPLGCWLSGGIDSSVIAAAMKSVVGKSQEVLTFSIGFDDPRYDETGYAAEVARHLGTRHQSFVVRPDAAVIADDLVRLATVFGEPFGDSSALPTHYLARETRKFVTVALSGDGGDELFGGYERYRALALAQRMDRWPSAIHPARLARLWGRLPGKHPKSLGMRMKRLMRVFGEAPANRYAQMMELFSPGDIDALMGADAGKGTGDQWQEEWEFAQKGGDVVAGAAALDRLFYLPDDIHTKVDRASMLHALEVRAPFMDGALLRFASGLAGEEMIGGGPKHLLRRAFASDLPAEVFSRRKMGFALPIGEWLATSLRPMLRDHLFATDSFALGHLNRAAVERIVGEHEAGAADHGQRLYALLMLELWWRTSRPGGRTKE